MTEGHLQGQFQGKKKYHFLQIKLRTCVIPPFHGILTEKSNYSIISMIQGHLQSQFQFRCQKYDFEKT